MWLNISTFRVLISQSKEANQRRTKNEKLRSEHFGSLRTRSWHVCAFQHFAVAAQLDK